MQGCPPQLEYRQPLPGEEIAQNRGHLQGEALLIVDVEPDQFLHLERGFESGLGGELEDGAGLQGIRQVMLLEMAGRLLPGVEGTGIGNGLVLVLPAVVLDPLPDRLLVPHQLHLALDVLDVPVGEALLMEGAQGCLVTVVVGWSQDHSGDAAPGHEGEVALRWIGAHPLLPVVPVEVLAQDMVDRLLAGEPQGVVVAAEPLLLHRASLAGGLQGGGDAELVGSLEDQLGDVEERVGPPLQADLLDQGLDVLALDPEGDLQVGKGGEDLVAAAPSPGLRTRLPLPLRAAFRNAGAVPAFLVPGSGDSVAVAGSGTTVATLATSLVPGSLVVGIGILPGSLLGPGRQEGCLQIQFLLFPGIAHSGVFSGR